MVGIGVPQVTATLECASAREEYFRRTGRYVSVITDGGIRTGGDLCKSIACGADAVMLGTPFAQAEEAPGRGFNWGMANSHPELPRGTRIKVGTKSPLSNILFGPTSATDGTQNLAGALKIAMGMCGAYTIRDLHKAADCHCAFHKDRRQDIPGGPVMRSGPHTALRGCFRSPFSPGGRRLG